MTQSNEDGSKVSQDRKVRQITCTVVSAGMGGSRVGLVARRVKHKVTGKYLNRSTRIMFDDPKGESKVGDLVQISSCRPMSKNKSHKLNSIERQAKG